MIKRIWFMDRSVIIGEMEINDIGTYREYNVIYDEILFADAASQDDETFEEIIFSEENNYTCPFSYEEIERMFVETPGYIIGEINIRRFLVREAEKRTQKGDAA